VRVHAIWLDVAHRLLTIERGEPGGGINGALFGVDVPAEERPLVALAAAAQHELGRAPGVPLGYRVVGGDAWCVVVGPAPRGGALVPLRTWAAEQPAAWRVYVDTMLGGWEPPTTELDVFYFGNEPQLASQLAHHVIKGTKRATVSWVAVAEHDGGSLPRAGMVSIVTDGFGVPLCAIETTRVERGRFGDAGPEIAEAEGEGDGSLADWRAAHQHYYEAEGTRIGIAFTDDADIVYEHFRVLRVFQRGC
jgi:uncharacterized protein YhfF